MKGLYTKWSVYKLVSRNCRGIVSFKNYPSKLSHAFSLRVKSFSFNDKNMNVSQIMGFKHGLTEKDPMTLLDIVKSDPNILLWFEFPCLCVVGLLKKCVAKRSGLRFRRLP